MKAALTATDASGIGKATGLLTAMHLDLLESTLLVVDEYPDLPAVVADPHLVSQVFGWDVIIGLLNLDVTVAMHGSGPFLKEREQTGRQGLEAGLF